MKVRLAVQVLSASVASALTYCKDREEFKGCEATIKFIQVFNDLFDALNSKSFNDSGYKHPLHKGNYEHLKRLFDSASTYITELKIDVPRQSKGKIVIERKQVVLSGMQID